MSRFTRKMAAGALAASLAGGVGFTTTAATAEDLEARATTEIANPTNEANVSVETMRDHAEVQNKMLRQIPLREFETLLESEEFHFIGYSKQVSDKLKEGNLRGVNKIIAFNPEWADISYDEAAKEVEALPLTEIIKGTTEKVPLPGFQRNLARWEKVLEVFPDWKDLTIKEVDDSLYNMPLSESIEAAQKGFTINSTYPAETMEALVHYNSDWADKSLAEVRKNIKGFTVGKILEELRNGIPLLGGNDPKHSEEILRFQLSYLEPLEDYIDLTLSEAFLLQLDHLKGQAGLPSATITEPEHISPAAPDVLSYYTIN